MTHKNYLIIGGTGGIGQAMIEQLIADPNYLDAESSNHRIFATYHNSIPSIEHESIYLIKMDVGDEESIKNAVSLIKMQTSHLNWVINAVGLLHNEHSQPEKSLRQMDSDFFLLNMQINALASLLIAKHVKPLLAKSDRSNLTPAIFATLSARVGSIGDNQLGGWYSYRMSKAALNMGMKNLSLEWQRSLKEVCVVVLQPGTVNTSLSAPFQANVADDHLFSPAYSAECLLDVLSSMTADNTGSFLDWSGESIPW